MTDDMIPQTTMDELLMHPFREVLGGELGKGAREGRLAGNFGAAFPAAYGGHDAEVRFAHARKILQFISRLREAPSGPVMVEKPDSLIGGREDGQSTLFRFRLACVKRTSVS
jgi:hypothetical protein